jgi:pyruvate dehydrogenase E2 component (dihydrolipoamide acetyltransferase)
VAVNVDNLIKLRGKLNTVAKSKISVNDMVIKAASLACVRVPETNSQWLGEAIRKFNNVNMSVAVQTDFGLMAPVITNTHLKGLDEIAAEIKDIAARAANCAAAALRLVVSHGHADQRGKHVLIFGAEIG